MCPGYLDQGGNTGLRMDVTEERSADEALNALRQLITACAHTTSEGAADALCTCVKAKGDD